MRDNGSPPPSFQFNEDHSYFATILPVHPEALAAADNLHGDLHGDLHGEAGEISEQVAAVLAHLEGEMTRQNLQAALGLANRDYFRKAYLVPAIEAGIVEMLHPDKPNSRIQRYRLTPAGKALRRQKRDAEMTD
jgi:ATP-dependent DNA helicase RecG